ncbi:MAG TPA: hypothetical protein VFC82_09650 [Actinomycetaceae bacterium]|nr:hypothetical protein [Actinomycetaceae bacterium]
MSDLITLEQAWNELTMEAVGWVMTPSEARWFRMTAERVPDWAPDRRGEPAGVFEMTAFDGVRAWTWANQSHGHGPLVTRTVPSEGLTNLTALAGEAESDGRDGWTNLVSGRGTRFRVPIELGLGERVVLEQREVTKSDSFGNVRVVATLPIALKRKGIER